MREVDRLEAELNQLRAQRERADVTSSSLYSIPRINARVADIQNRLIYLAFRITEIVGQAMVLRMSGD